MHPIAAWKLSNMFRSAVARSGEGSVPEPATLPYAINFDSEETDAEPSNITVVSGTWLTKAIPNDANSYAPTGFAKVAQLAAQSSGRFMFELPEATDGDGFRIEVLTVSSDNVNSQQIHCGLMAAFAWAPTDSVLSPYGYGPTSIETFGGNYCNDGVGWATALTPTAVSPVRGHTRWNIHQFEYNVGVRRLYSEFLQAEDLATTGIDYIDASAYNGDVSVAVTIGPWATGACTWSFAQIWVGNVTDAWPDGAKV